MPKLIDILKLNNNLADKVWDIVRFWSNFDQTIIGNKLVSSLDNISINLSLLINADKKEKIKILKEINNKIVEAAVLNDIARRRKILEKQEYNRIYVSLNKIKEKMNKNSVFLKT